MDIDSLSKNFTQSLSAGPFNDLFINPIYVAFLITTIVILIAVLMFNESKLIKTSFYILCANIFIVFIHNKLLLIEHRKQLCKNDSNTIISTIGAGRDSANSLSYLQM